MSKTHQFTVLSAFVHEGKIRTPKAKIDLAEKDAKPLLERGKIELAKGGGAKPGAKKAEGSEPAGGAD